jgi:hypothetical protein
VIGHRPGQARAPNDHTTLDPKVRGVSKLFLQPLYRVTTRTRQAEPSPWPSQTSPRLATRNTLPTTRIQQCTHYLCGMCALMASRATGVTTRWTLHHGAVRAKAFSPLFIRRKALDHFEPIVYHNQIESRIWRTGRSHCSHSEMILLVYHCMLHAACCQYYRAKCQGLRLCRLRQVTANSALRDVSPERIVSLHSLPPFDESGAPAIATSESEWDNDDDCILLQDRHMQFEIVHPSCLFSALFAAR